MGYPYPYTHPPWGSEEFVFKNFVFLVNWNHSAAIRYPWGRPFAAFQFYVSLWCGNTTTTKTTITRANENLFNKKFFCGLQSTLAVRGPIIMLSLQLLLSLLLYLPNRPQSTDSTGPKVRHQQVFLKKKNANWVALTSTVVCFDHLATHKSML